MLLNSANVSFCSHSTISWVHFAYVWRLFYPKNCRYLLINRSQRLHCSKKFDKFRWHLFKCILSQLNFSQTLTSLKVIHTQLKGCWNNSILEQWTTTCTRAYYRPTDSVKANRNSFIGVWDISGRNFTTLSLMFWVSCGLFSKWSTLSNTRYLNPAPMMQS